MSERTDETMIQRDREIAKDKMAARLRSLYAFHLEWSQHNFPEADPWEPFTGMVEEMGEYAENLLLPATTEERKDDIGDVMMYMVHFCRLNDLDFTGMALQAFEFSLMKPQDIHHETTILLRDIGKLGHSFLKATQGIRGDYFEHLSDMENAIKTIIIDLRRIALHHGFTLWEAINRAWAEIAERDWQKNNIDGSH